jgi:hypothetical protein
MPAYNYYPTYYGNAGWGTPYAGQQAFAPYPQQPVSMAQMSPQFMIQVDGEIGAKAWQPQTALNPNTIIPLWDYDGIHVYFKSTDAYGRMNPVRKGRVVFDDEPQNLPQGNGGVSGAGENPQLGTPPVSHENYVTKEDLASLKDEIREMLMQQNQKPSYATNISSQTNQNGNNNKGGNR